MSLPRLILRRLSTLFRRDRIEADMAEEMRAHLELQAAENRRRGMDAAEARFAAQRAFGGIEQIKERAREQRVGHWFETLWRDVRYGARSLARQPGFTLLAVLALSFGIGVNTTVFSIVQDLFSRPAGRDRALRLVGVHLARRENAGGFRRFSHAEYEAVRAAGMFTHAAAFQFSGARLGKTDPRPRLVCFTSEDYFRLFDVAPWRGRFFTAEETKPNADAPLVVASYVYWQRIGSPANFVGSQLEVDGRACTVIGIAPRGFGGQHWSIGPDVWVPLGLIKSVGSGRTDPTDARSQPFLVSARLAPALDISSANAALGGLNATLNAITGATDTNRVELVVARPARADLDTTAPANESNLLRYGYMALAVAVAVMLVACLNVANMLLARGTARQKEIALRLSLGATRGRIVRQLLTEGLVLALFGGVVGVALSRLVNDVLLDLTRKVSSHQPFAFHLQTTVDWQLVGGAFLLCLLATLVCSIGPALRATQVDLNQDLKRQSGDPAALGRWNRFFAGRHVLVMLQMAFSVVLLFAAGLVVRSGMNIDRDRGFSVDDQLIVKADYFIEGTPRAEWPRLQQALAARIAAVPGVERVALASSVPYNFDASWWRVYAGGQDAARGETHTHAIHTAVSEGYFSTLGIPLLRGREFTALDNQPDNAARRVAIIDERLAKTLFGDTNALGRRIAFNPADAKSSDANVGCEVIGIVRSPTEDPLAGERPARLYRPLAQSPAGRIYFHARAARPEVLAPALRQAMGAFDRERPVLFSGPLSEIVDHNLNLWSMRMAATMFGVFGGAAVLLAAIGVYGVKAYAVGRRTREIGVRIALGAETRDILRLILRQGVLQAIVGVGLGVALAVLAGVGLSALLYRVAATDPVLLAIAASLMAACAIVATAVPAWRATRISPTEALRCE